MRNKLTAAMLIAFWAASVSFVIPLGQDLAQATHGQVRISGPCDFVAFWAAGRLAAAGNAPGTYDVNTMLNTEAANPAANGLQLPWYYPPTTLLLAVPAQLPPFLPAFLLWEIALTAASALLLRAAALPWQVILASLLSPAALFNADTGQLGLLTAAITLCALSLAETRPALSGTLFGLLIFKPQAGLIAPFVLLTRGQGLAAGAAIAIALCALTAAAFGLPVWHVFFTKGLALSRFILDEPFPNHPGPIISSHEFYGISVFWMCRSLGCGVPASGLIQGLAAAGAMLACALIWRRRRANPTARVALSLCLALLATPYAYVYDLCGASAAFAALAHQERRLVFSDVLLWTWPVTGSIIARHLYLELAPVMLCLSAWRAARLLVPAKS